MGMRWLSSSIIIIVIISTSNTQNIANKWKIEDRKHSSSDDKNNIENKKGTSYKKIKSLDEKPNASNLVNKQFEKLLESSDGVAKLVGFNSPSSQTLPDVDQSSKPHSRKKRLIWVSDDGRLALPPGTVLSISPTLSMPLVRYPPTGFLSNLTMSFPLTSKFLYNNKLVSGILNNLIKLL